jgi:hypothetical protein
VAPRPLAQVPAPLPRAPPSVVVVPAVAVVITIAVAVAITVVLGLLVLPVLLYATTRGLVMREGA